MQDNISTLMNFEDTDSELGTRKYCNKQRCGVKNTGNLKVVFDSAEYQCHDA